jgi:cysteine synthase
MNSNDFISNDLAELIGNTPLLRLRKLSDQTGCNIYGKCEFMNPGGSIKDRTALGLIRSAVQSGELKPGGTIVEGTAGNTGIGLTILANSMGYSTRIVMPMNQSREKIEQLELLGAQLELVQSTSYDDPNHYVHRARSVAEKLNQDQPGSAFWAGQFNNTANRDIHYETTGQEIWQQTEGKIDAFICAVGTGGTIAGVAKALREKKQEVQIGLADPLGSALFNYFNSGELLFEGHSIAEGIGISHITDNLAGTEIDFPTQISDEEALPLIYDLLANEGICLGASSAINMAGAVKMAEELGPGHTIVTVLCDYGTRYQSKVYNPVFLKSKGLPLPPWL